VTTPSLNIAALTKRTGVPQDTIRKWEQRYGVLRPERTAGGQRRYSELDVARVEWLKARLSEGYRIGEAASLLGPGERVPLSAGELRNEIVDATLRTDVSGLGKLVEQALSLSSLQDAFFDVLGPALTDVGTRWEAGEITVAQEHLASSTVRGAMQRLLADVRAGIRGVAVLACVPGEQHEIGLLMFAVLLRADGWQVAYLGADTPVADAVELARDLGASALCFSAGTSEGAHALESKLEHVPAETKVLLGGRGTDHDDAAAVVASLRRLAA
jgi:MerR family transcriptional regulator, light-induced transcriptional regulator